MRTEKEIRDRLKIALEDYNNLREEYLNTPYYKDKYLADICDDMTYIEAEIKTLRWILGE